MLFHSTRNQAHQVRAGEAILRGLAEDGGLFVPHEIPRADWSTWLDDTYDVCAAKILSLYFDFDPAAIRQATQVYTRRFPDRPCPVRAVRRVQEAATDRQDYVLELFHGPTLAFKDFALTLLPYLMQLAMEQNRVSDERMLILTATSGDTGKAALEGFVGSSRISVMVFYPNQGVSPMQRLQMVTQEGEHAFVYGIKGDFDDAQNAVKQIFNNRELRAELASQGIRLSSANSINIGRLIPQIAYYVWGYLELVRRQAIRYGESIDVAVPTGNFGNILAARYAKEMGLPLRNLICASNENHILTDFFNSGEYDRRRELFLTSSPSMDILVSSNLERYLYLLNPEQAGDCMRALQQDGFFRWPDSFPEDLHAYYADEADVSRMIARCHEEGYLIDPHTAVAFSAVAQERARQADDETICLIASTASAFKFPRKVLQAITGVDQSDSAQRTDAADFMDLRRLSDLSGEPVPRALAELNKKSIRHGSVIAKDRIASVVRAFGGIQAGV